METISQCPKCNKLNPNESWVLITCECSHKYSFLACTHCKRNVYFIDIIYTQGYSIKCPYNDCQKYFSYSKCRACSRILEYDDKYFEGRV